MALNDPVLLTFGINGTGVCSTDSSLHQSTRGYRLKSLLHGFKSWLQPGPGLCGELPDANFFLDQYVAADQSDDYSHESVLVYIWPGVVRTGWLEARMSKSDTRPMAWVLFHVFCSLKCVACHIPLSKAGCAGAPSLAALPIELDCVHLQHSELDGYAEPQPSSMAAWKTSNGGQVAQSCLSWHQHEMERGCCAVLVALGWICSSCLRVCL